MKKIFFIVFLFGKMRSFAYVPVRYQNHVVRGKRLSDLLDVFYYFFWKKVLKIISQMTKDKMCLVFFDLKKRFKYN